MAPEIELPLGGRTRGRVRFCLLLAASVALILGGLADLRRTAPSTRA